LTGIPQSAVILLTGLVYYAVDFRLMRHYDRHSSQGPSARSWRYTFLMVAVWALLVVQPVLLPGLGVSTVARWGRAIQAAGIALISCALALHWWARSHLQHFCVEDVRFQGAQYLVDTGPYSRVRHLVFTSFLLIAVGPSLVKPAITTLAMVLYVSLDFSSAAREEEASLLEKLPEYSKYMEHRCRFFPKWWR